MNKVYNMEDYKEFVPKELVLSCFYDWIDTRGYMHSADEDMTYQKIESLPSVELEPLTDKEQRIFISAMAREEKICKEVDSECRNCREPYEDSLLSICRQITRKVKDALWN